MKVIIAGGGTAGHINPGLAIAKYIKNENSDARIIFIGTQKGLENQLVPREGFELRLIKVKGFKRSLSLDTLRTIKEMFQGIAEARSIIKKSKPDIVIGTGGYVCGPVLLNAALMKIPTLIHEQNAYPGITNRILSRFVDKVAISFEESEKYFPSKKKLIFTGNPVRKELLLANRITERAKRKLASNEKLVVVVGGSLGADKINSAIVELLKKHKKENDFKLIFATGTSRYDAIMKQLEGVKLLNSEVMPYIYDAAGTYSASDLVICRAGAITSSELTVMGIPSIMIPSPNVTANHQEHNARALEKQGATVVVLEKDLDAESLYLKICSVLDDTQRLRDMAVKSKLMGISNATDKIYEVVKQLLKK